MNAVMPTIKRARGKPYRWTIEPAPLAKIANHEKMMPKNFIRADGYGITAACRNYLEPLIAGEVYPPYENGIPTYLRVPKKFVKRRLPEYTIADAETACRSVVDTAAGAAGMETGVSGCRKQWESFMILGNRIGWMLLLVLGVAQAIAEEAKPMTNADVVEMVKAGLPESTVVLSVKSSESAFDTDAAALIELSKQKVPTAVVEAMIRAASGEQAPARSGPSKRRLQEEYRRRRCRRAEDALFDAGHSPSRACVRLRRCGGVCGAAGEERGAAIAVATTHVRSWRSPRMRRRRVTSPWRNLAIRRNGTREVMIGGAT